MAPTFADRVLGALVGGAIGDAWGGPYEGLVPPFEVRPPARFQVSDDTQLTVATCESVVERGRVDPEHLASRLLAWYRAGRLLGLGASTLKALRDLDAGAHWALSGARGERSAGAGAAMRIAPLAFSLDPDDARDRTLFRDICRITHHHDEAYLGALAMAYGLRWLATTGEPEAAERLPAVVAEQLPDCRVRDRLRELAADGLSDFAGLCRRSPRAGGAAFEVVPLALALASLAEQRPFLSILESAIGVGGDTDTLAALVGQLVGVARGHSRLAAEAAIPEGALAEELPVFRQLADLAATGRPG